MSNKNKKPKVKKVYTVKVPDKSEMMNDYLPKKASDYEERYSKREKKRHNEFTQRKKRVKHQSEEIPPLSQREREHLTYLRVLGKYNELKNRRNSVRHYGILFILFSGLAYLALMFSLETKVEFLILWVITIIVSVFVMVHADYKYHCFKEYLGIADEFDFYDYEEENGEELDSIPPMENQNGKGDFTQ